MIHPKSSFPGGDAARRGGGFTLMEVNIALLVIAVGLSSMLALFPVGLRESNTATSETIQSAAASYILARLHANADEGDWGDNPAPAIGKGFSYSSDADGATHLLQGKDAKAFEGSPVRYQLRIDKVPDYDGFLYFAQLRVSDRKNGDITREPVYYTEFIRKGDF